MWVDYIYGYLLYDLVLHLCTMDRAAVMLAFRCQYPEWCTNIFIHTPESWKWEFPHFTTNFLGLFYNKKIFQLPLDFCNLIYTCFLEYLHLSLFILWSFHFHLLIDYQYIVRFIVLEFGVEINLCLTGIIPIGEIGDTAEEDAAALIKVTSFKI